MAPRADQAPIKVPANAVVIRTGAESASISGQGGFVLGTSGSGSVVLVSSDEDMAENEKEALTEVDREAAIMRREMERAVKEDFDAVYLEIHERFMEQAPAVGDDWAKIAFLIGFPDPGEPRVPAPEGTLKALEQAEARLARARISEAAEAFRAEVLSLLEAARNRRRQLQTDMEVQIAVLKDEALRKAREESLERRAQLVEVASNMGSVSTSLPATRGNTGTVPALAAAGPVWPSAEQSGWRAAEREGRLTRLFLALQGKELSQSAGEDLTLEYRRWAGPSKAGR
ncbi:MAG: hypothetical protein AB7F50_07685 [Fimbriimonadaceae bacterium]